MIYTKTVPLHFDAVSSASFLINVPMTVKEIRIKQLTVINPGTGPASPVGVITSDLIPGNQTMCSVPLIATTYFTGQLNTRFTLNNPSVNSTYTFRLTYDGQQDLVGLAATDAWVDITMEFHS